MRARLSAAQALESPWVREGGCAPETPLEGTVVQRLQRHATYGHLKQLARGPPCACVLRGFWGVCSRGTLRLQHHAICSHLERLAPACVMSISGELRTEFVQSLDCAARQ